MENLNIPIFKKSYILYRSIHSFRNLVAKQDRFTIWQKNENLILEFIEFIIIASQNYKTDKLIILKKASVKLNLIRVFLRLMKDIETIDSKRYIQLESEVDEIGRMLGGWIRANQH